MSNGDVDVSLVTPSERDEYARSRSAADGKQFTRNAYTAFVIGIAVALLIICGVAFGSIAAGASKQGSLLDIILTVVFVAWFIAIFVGNGSIKQKRTEHMKTGASTSRASSAASGTTRVCIDRPVAMTRPRCVSRSTSGTPSTVS